MWQNLLDMFYVEGDMLKTVCQMTVLFMVFILILDIVYVIKSAVKTGF